MRDIGGRLSRVVVIERKYSFGYGQDMREIYR